MRELEIIKSLLQREEELVVYQEMERCCEAMEKQMADGIYQSMDVERGVIKLLSSELMYDSYFIYLVSFVMKCFKKADYVELLCDLIATNEYMTEWNRKFALYQVKAFLFRYPNLETAKVRELIGNIENSLRSYFLNQFVLERREKTTRNNGTVLVLTHGFLGERHPVSRSALERSVILQKELGKRVFLVSTGEDSQMSHATPMYQAEVRNRNEMFNGAQIYPFLGEKVSLYQPINPADDIVGISELINYVRTINPEFVVYVGEQSFIADLLNEIVPVLAVSTIFSVLQKTHTEFVAVGRRATEEEKKESYAEIIESLFTFKLKEKKHDYTRDELDIPKDKFVLAVVGTRLNADVTEEFLTAMKETVDAGCYLLFIGRFDAYERWCEKLPWMAENSKSLGMVDDVIGILEVADLYVNPLRLGGGYSVAEAFDAGIPAVTINYGDVAAATGEVFWVADYEEMVEQIKKYHIDSGFYDTMKTVAKQRLKELTSESGGFADAVRRMMESPRFY